MLNNKEDYAHLELCEECQIDCHSECPNKQLTGYDNPVCGCERCLK